LAPPLGLLYIGSCLEKAGHEVYVVDFSSERFSKKRLEKAVTDVDVIGITVLTPGLSSVQKIIQCCRSINPLIPILIGGPHCSLFPERTLDKLDADVCVQGEGEEAFILVINNLSLNNGYEHIPGIFYRDHERKIKKGLEIKVVKNIDSFGVPARHLVENYVYGKWYNPRIKKGEFTSILFSRGCPYRCRFCSRGAIGFHRFRRRSVSHILSELSELSSNGYRHISVNDDCFPTVKEEAMELFEGIIADDLDFQIYLNASRVNLIDQELLDIMRQAGVVHIQFGLESGSQEILDFYQKETKVEQIEAIVTQSHKKGFFTAGSFILGAPIETRKHLLQTIHFAERLPLNSVSYLPLRYMAGSSLWEWAVSEKKIKDNEYLIPADKNRGLSNFTYNELVSLCTNAQLRYYIRPKYVVSLLHTIVHQNNPEILLSFLKILTS
jgi:radical SAM superfamily enzyme YgiQ (UPF0313 family)